MKGRVLVSKANISLRIKLLLGRKTQGLVDANF